MSEEIKIIVHGGMCKLKFSSWASTGPTGSDSDPGVGFELISDVPARERGDKKYYAGTGVIGREDARRLRNLLDGFLVDYEGGPCQ